MEQLTHFIDGKMVGGNSGRFGDVFDPATGQVQKQVPMATEVELDAAVKAASAAFPAWAAMPALRRARCMFRLKTLIDEHKAALAGLLTSEHGKVRDDALGEVTRGLEVVEFACGAPQLLKGEFTDSIGTGVDAYSFRQPLGVVAGITPFNFPAMVPLWMIPMALVCGNTFVLKPSERDPGASMLLAELIQQAGVPDGVFNVIHGDRVAVDAILAHPDIKAISFVGSTPIAKKIFEVGSANGKRVQALGGAKTQRVVMPDAPLEATADALMGSAFGSAGERCMAISVAVVVGDEMADKLIAELKPRVESLSIQPGNIDGAEMGPLITGEHHAKVSGYVDLGVEEGADLVVDGRGFKHVDQPDGFFIGGCLFDNVKADMRIYQEEILARYYVWSGLIPMTRPLT